MRHGDTFNADQKNIGTHMKLTLKNGRICTINLSMSDELIPLVQQRMTEEVDNQLARLRYNKNIFNENDKKIIALVDESSMIDLMMIKREIDDQVSFNDYHHEFDITLSEDAGFYLATSKTDKPFTDLPFKYEKHNELSFDNVYQHYIQYCVREQMKPVSKIALSKLIRLVFPTVVETRLNDGQRSRGFLGLQFATPIVNNVT